MTPEGSARACRGRRRCRPKRGRSPSRCSGSPFAGSGGRSGRSCREAATSNPPVSGLQPTRLLAARRPGESVKALAARHGPPEPKPELRKDLTVRRQVQLGEVMWIVNDPRAMADYKFKAGQWRLIRLFDGSRTQSEVLAEDNRRVGRTAIDLSVVLEWEEILRRMELIELTAAERSLTLLDKFKSLRDKTA